MFACISNMAGARESMKYCVRPVADSREVGDGSTNDFVIFAAAIEAETLAIQRTLGVRQHPRSDAGDAQLAR